MHWISRGWILFVVLLVCSLLTQTGFFPHQSEQVLDLLFSLRGERPTSLEIVIVGVDEPSIRKLGAWPFPRENHALLFKRLKEAKVVGFDLIFSEDSADMELLSSKGVPAVMAAASSYEGKILAPDVSSNPWIKLGHVETELGTDGIVRRVKLVKNGLPSLAFAMEGMQNREEGGARRLINFYGPEFTFLYLSYLDVLEGKYSSDFFKNRYVLVGAKALGLGDVHMIPFSRKHPIPGVEIQATILNNLLDSSFLRTTSFKRHFLFSFLMLIVLAFLLPCYSVGKNMALLSGVLALLVVASYVCFAQNFFFDPFLPSFMAVAGFLIHTGIVWMTVTKDVLSEIRTLNTKLEEGTQTFFRTVPYPLEASVRGEGSSRVAHFGGLDRHMNRLNRGIRALSLQNSFVQHLVSAEAPPLIFWAKKSGQVVVANSRCIALWKRLKISDEPLDLHTFFRLLEDNRLKSEQKDKLPVSPSDEVSFQGEIVCDIVLRTTGQRTYLRVVTHEVDEQVLGFRGVVASFTDVTEIRELERLKGEVMNIVSHELKLPLTTIMGYGELLADSLDGQKREYAVQVSEQARRLAGMISDFLDISRIESGKYVINRFPFDFVDVINDSLTVAGASAEAKKISLESRLPTRVTPFLGDETLMTQVVINLLDNAIKFSPEGTTVRLELVELENAFHFSVADEGIGVPDNEKEEIFRKFSRGAKQGRGTGFGLGLSFVLQVIDSHGGSINVRDGEQGGAIFCVSLPKQ